MIKTIISISHRISCFSFVTMVIFCVLSAGIAYSQESEKENDFQFLFEPYLMFSSINGDASVGRATGVSVDLDTSDILENLDFGIMFHMEGLYKNWGLAFDYGLMDLKQDIAGPINGIITAGVRQQMIELFVFRRIPIKAGKIDVLAGGRSWDNKISLTLDPAWLPGSASAQQQEDWIDPFLGARAYFDLAEDWTFFIRGDIGGFGIASDFTALGNLGVMYNITKTIILDIQYKALWVDYENGTKNTPGYFAYDTVTHGPIIGLIFQF